MQSGGMLLLQVRLWYPLEQAVWPLVAFSYTKELLINNMDIQASEILCGAMT